jgi:NADH dehydrogenase (ubiquinone) Fe-S protein 3
MILFNLLFNKLFLVLPILLTTQFQKEIILTVLPEDVLFCFTILKKHINYKFQLLSSISGVDLLNKTYRFCIAYDIISLLYNIRLRVKIFINEMTNIVSLTSIFINSSWWEREIWDLYGIFFENHNDLRRILTDYGFEGHPMRKDFPLCGFTEVRYNESKKRIVSENVQLTQEFRVFSFNISW